MITRKEFSEQVEKLLVKGRGADVMSAIVKVCDLNNIEPESAKRLLTQPLKDKLEAEAAGLNLINRGNNSKGSITSFFSD
tara:strand:- start:26 stop:265 length:240 start_codon:yes stop_codon:yes gene_type:complete